MRCNFRAVNGAILRIDNPSRAVLAGFAQGLVPKCFFEGVVAIHGLTSGFVYSENKTISMEGGGRDRLAV